MKVEELRADYRVTRETATGAELLALIQRQREAIERVRSSARRLSSETLAPVVGDALPPLPDGWVWARLDAIADIKGGITKDQKRNLEECELLPYLRVANVQRGFLDLSEMKEIPVPKESVDTLLLEPGDVLFNEGGDRDKLGRGWVWNGQIRRCVFQNHVFRARFYLPDSMEPKFISWYANTFGQDYFMAKGKQTTNLASINKTMLSAFPVPIAPLDQQKRIVAEIEKQFSRLDEAVANLKHVKANLKRYKAAVLKAAVEGRLVETEAERARREGRSYETGAQLLQRILDTRRSQWQGKGKYKEPAAPDTTNLPELPEGWVWVTWEMILAPEDGAFRRGPFGSTLKKSIFVEFGHKVYEQCNAINDDPSFGRYYITDDKYKSMNAFAVRAGDFLVSCSGTIGRITQIPERFESGVINQALLRVRTNNTVISDGYFLMLFRSPYFQQQILDNAQGAAMTNVKGVADLKAIPIPLPPVPDQARIVSDVERRLSLLHETEAQVAANLQRAKRLSESILAASFSKKLEIEGLNNG